MRHPIRTRNGRAIAASVPSARPHGRLVPTAPASRVSTNLGDPAERYALACVEQTVARRSEDPKGKRSAKQRRDRARAALVAQPGGLEEVRRITVALASCGGAMLRIVERAHVDLREFAARAAVSFVALVREHDVQSTAALLLLASAARGLSIAAMLHERAYAVSPAILASSKTAKVGDGGSVSATLASHGDLLKLSTQVASTARNDLLSALDLEQRSRDERQRGALVPPPDLAARVERMRADRAARTASPEVVEAPAEPETVKRFPTAVPAEVESRPVAAPETPSAPAEAQGPLPEPSARPAPVLERPGAPLPPAPATAASNGFAAMGAVSVLVQASAVDVLRFEGHVRELNRPLPAAGSRPSAHALAAMRARGVDVSRWDRREDT